MVLPPLSLSLSLFLSCLHFRSSLTHSLAPSIGSPASRIRRTLRHLIPLASHERHSFSPAAVLSCTSLPPILSRSHTHARRETSVERQRRARLHTQNMPFSLITKESCDRVNKADDTIPLPSSLSLSLSVSPSRIMSRRQATIASSRAARLVAGKRVKRSIYCFHCM